MRRVRRALRHRAGRLAHHRHRSAAGSRIRAGRHQHRLQRGFLQHQPLAGERRPEDRPVQRAVEIETLKAQAEVQPIVALADQLSDLKQNGAGALDAYVRNVRLKLYSEAKTVILEASHE